MALGHGGKREGAGRPPGGTLGGDALNAERGQARADFEAERARHEKIKADEREFEFAIRRGEYLPRDAQRRAAATALAVLAQSVRSIPDNLERTLGLDPETVEQVAIQLDQALASVSEAFHAMTNDG